MCTCSTVGTGTAEACLAARQTASLRVSHDRVDERVVRHADSTGMRDFSVHCSGAQHELAVVMARQRSGAQAVLVTNGGPTLADAEKPDENSRFRVAMEHRGDAPTLLQLLQQAGYSTDPNYAAKVLRIIAVYHLEIYDLI